MYFPFFKPQAGGKRFAAQPQSIYSEFPQAMLCSLHCWALPGSRGREGECVYWIRPLSFSSSSMSVPLAFFRTIFRSSRSLKLSLISVMGFLSMA